MAPERRFAPGREGKRRGRTPRGRGRTRGVEDAVGGGGAGPGDRGTAIRGSCVLRGRPCAIEGRQRAGHLGPRSDSRGGALHAGATPRSPVPLGSPSEEMLHLQPGEEFGARPRGGVLRCRGGAAMGQPVPRSGLLAGRRAVGVQGRWRRRGSVVVPRGWRSAVGLLAVRGQRRRRRGRCPAHARRPGGGSSECRGRAATTKQGGFPGPAVGRPASRGPGTAATTAQQVPRSRLLADRGVVGVQGRRRQRRSVVIPRAWRSAAGLLAARAGCAVGPGLARPRPRRPSLARARRRSIQRAPCDLGEYAPS